MRERHYAEGSGGTAERPVSRDVARLRDLWRFLAPYRWQLIATLVVLVVAAATVLVLGSGLRYLVDHGFAAGDAGLLDVSVLVLLGIVTAMAVASYARFYLVSWLGERVVADLRQAVFTHILSLSPAFFETTRTGEILSRLTTDTTLIQVVIGTSVPIALRNFLMFIGGAVMLIITSPKLTGLVALVVPLVLVPIILFGRRVRVLSKSSQDRVADVGAYVEETLGFIRTVQAFGHEAQDRRLFHDRVESAFAVSMHRVSARALLTAVVILLVFGAVSSILWIGGHDVLVGRLSAGDLSAFVFYAVVVAGSLGSISEVVGDLQRASGATDRLLELLATRPDIAAPAQPMLLPQPPRGDIAFEAVRFHYPSAPDRPALDGFSLTVQPGETVALVGPSGAGKSTVFQLLLRFYDPQEGSIRLDGCDLRRTEPGAARARLGLVPQDPVIFSTNARENIRYGRPDATDAEVRAAAASAAALSFIERLPDGFDTYLGEKGVRLSGGQRQRIALARAILRSPAVLLLDEATSALDAESELLVQTALEKLMVDRTTLVIAHRLATVLQADRIVVIDHGRINAIGTHSELVRQDGLYARLARLQFDDTRLEAELAGTDDRDRHRDGEGPPSAGTALPESPFSGRTAVTGSISSDFLT